MMITNDPYSRSYLTPLCPEKVSSNALTLSSLLPRKQEIIYKALQEYALLLNALKETIETLDNGNLEAFDALVCENLCQVRAFYIPLHFKECSESFTPSMRETLENIIQAVEKRIKEQEKKEKQRFPKGEDIRNLLQNDLDIPLTEIQEVFLQCYLLTKVKEQKNSFDRPDETNYQKLKILGSSVSGQFCKALVDTTRVKVSKITAPFLQSLARECGDRTSFEMLAQKEIIRLIEGQECPPSFRATQVILNAMLFKRIPLILWVEQKKEDGTKIKEFCLYYEPNATGTRFIEKSPSLEDAKRPVVVVQVMSRKNKEQFYSKELSYHKFTRGTFDPVEFILAAAASHRQYPDGVELRNSDMSYMKFKEMATKNKWTKDNNPKPLYVHHIFCQLLGNIKPIKYKKSSYLEANYGNFYRETEFKVLKKIAKELDIEIKNENKKISISFKEKDINSINEKLISLKNHIIDSENVKPYSGNFLHQIPYELIQKIRDNIPITLNPIELEENWSGFDLLKLAKIHPNPPKFVLDHFCYWDENSCSYGNQIVIYKHIFEPEKWKEFIEFLNNEPNSFKEPDFMNLLSDLLYDHIDKIRTGRYRRYQESMKPVIQGIIKALDIPELKERANHLLYFASRYYLIDHYNPLIKMGPDKAFDPEHSCKLEVDLTNDCYLPLPQSVRESSIRDDLHTSQKKNFSPRRMRHKFLHSKAEHKAKQKPDYDQNPLQALPTPKDLISRSRTSRRFLVHELLADKNMLSLKDKPR